MLAESEHLLMTNRTVVNLNHATSIVVETESIACADPVFVTRSGIINIRDEFITPKGIFYKYLHERMPKFVSIC